MLYVSPLSFKKFWPASTLLREPIVIAILSLPETDPQIFGTLELGVEPRECDSSGRVDVDNGGPVDPTRSCRLERRRWSATFPTLNQDLGAVGCVNASDGF